MPAAEREATGTGHPAERARKRAAALLDDYAAVDAPTLIEHMVRREFKGRVAVTSSFGAEAALLLDMIAQADRSVPVLFIDTDALFDETLEYASRLQARLGLTDLRIVRPDSAALKEAEELWECDADRCCHLRKVAPLAREVQGLREQGFEALIDGRKRLHGGERASLPVFQADLSGMIKISPLASWSEAQVEAAFVERGLPRHPLTAQGFRSIGCWPCTRPVAAGEPPRSGRWAGAGKTECGIHRPISEGTVP